MKVYFLKHNYFIIIYIFYYNSEISHAMIHIYEMCIRYDTYLIRQYANF